MLDSCSWVWEGSLPRGGAGQWDGFVQLLPEHSDSEPEPLRLSSPFGGPEPWEVLASGWGWWSAGLDVSPWLQCQFACWGLETLRNGKFWKMELK